MRRSSIIPFAETSFAPVTLMQDFDREFDNFFDSIQNLRSTYPSSYSSLKETKNAYVASIDMPGMKVGDIDIHVKDNCISIEAERKDVEDEDSVYRRFSQTFVLPQNIEEGNVESHYANGVLTLVFPKSKKVELTGKKVEVFTGEKPKKWMDYLQKEDVKIKEDKRSLN